MWPRTKHPEVVQAPGVGGAALLLLLWLVTVVAADPVGAGEGRAAPAMGAAAAEAEAAAPAADRAVLLERGLAREVEAGRLAAEVQGVRGAFSGDEENEDEESDPPFGPQLLPRVPPADTGEGEPERHASGASAGATLLHEHPKADQMLQGIVNGLKDKEINVALLGQHKYMANDCLGIKVSVGEFTMRLGTPVAKFEDGDLVLAFAVDEVAMSAFRLRFRPNPTNLAKPCSFSRRVEVGGTARDIRLEMRMDLSLDLDRCRVSNIGQVRVLARVGALNLKPLQNDLDQVAKNMIEDALTVSLQLMASGGASAEAVGVTQAGVLNEVIRAVDQVLEADCPHRQIDRAARLVRTGSAAEGPGAGAGRGAGVMGAGAERDASVPSREPGAVPADAGGSPPTDYRVTGIDETSGLITATDSRGSGRQVSFRLVDPNFLKSLKLGDWVNVGIHGKTLHLAVPIQDITVTEGAAAGDAAAGGDAAEAVAAEGAGEPETRAAAAAFTLTPDPQLTGRLGRLVITFPENSHVAQTRTEVYRGDDSERKNRVADIFGSGQVELLPGRYTVFVNSKPVENVEVRSGHGTRMHLGVLRLQADERTRFEIFAPGEERRLTDHFGSGDLGFPQGEIEVQVAGQRERVLIEDGKVTPF